MFLLIRFDLLLIVPIPDIPDDGAEEKRKVERDDGEDEEEEEGERKKCARGSVEGSGLTNSCVSGSRDLRRPSST